ncbi:MAG: uroporphyrinogen decarboxylase [Eubacteriaceae bacterium]|nr:uroporphyrinogen decarboxylase [Eubacteriaceae bacterium]
MPNNLAEERKQINSDVVNNIIPKRIPITMGIGLFALAQIAGVDPRIAYWDPSGLEKTVDELCARMPVDSNIMGRQILTPSKYQALGSKSIAISNSGFMQHPNTHMMEPEEYDEFIKDPYAFIVETAAPRINVNLDIKANPIRALSAIAQAISTQDAVNAAAGKITGAMSAKYGYPAPNPPGGGGYAPFDILTDQLRSFSGMLADVRRNRDKVSAAVEAVYPMSYKSCAPNPAIYTRNSYGSYPLHMPTFMREIDFAELWWPSFYRLWNDFASLGYRCYAFLEDDWMRYLDYVQDLPTGSVFKFEYGDPQVMKDRLGTKHIIDGSFPIEHLTKCTVDEAIDKTKEWLDIMAPGGQYIFGLNKGILAASDVNLDNMEAICTTVLNEGVYANAGQATGELFDKDDYSHSEFVPFVSRAYQTFEEYCELHPNTAPEARPFVEASEFTIFRFFYSLMQ